MAVATNWKSDSPGRTPTPPLTMMSLDFPAAIPLDGRLTLKEPPLGQVVNRQTARSCSFPGLPMCR